MIDVSYRYKKADLRGGRMMLDPETGIITLEGVPVDEHVEMPLPKDFGMTIEQEQQFEQEAKPTAPVKKVKAHGKA